MTMEAYVFGTRLEGWRGVRRTIAIRSDQTLVDLHNALQDAYDWDDDHLYSFWLGGKFWARDGSEYTHPLTLENDPFAGWGLPISKPGRRTSGQRLDRLGLTEAQRIAYLFDFGDEWRVVLTLLRSTSDDGGEYPRLLESVGESPPQYPDYEDEEDAA
jgi:hypothetical protein